MAKLFSLKTGSLPSKGRAGDCYFTTDSKQVYITVGDGTLLNLADLISGASPYVQCVGPQGERGMSGKDSQVPGPKGDKGDSGRDGQTGSQGKPGRDGVGLDGQTGKPGRDGKDSVVPGPTGPRGERGEKGERGERGDVTIVGSAELAAAVEKLRAQKAAALALILEKIKAMGNHGVYAVAARHLKDVQEELQ